MTTAQIQLVKRAQRETGVDNSDYRLILRNLGKVDSCKDLSPIRFEDVMAHFEGRGFRHLGKPENYWRLKVELRGRLASSEAVHLIKELSSKVDRYPLESLCRKVSGGNAIIPERLNPRQAYELTEILKAVISRSARADRTAQTSGPAEVYNPSAGPDQ